MKKHFFIFFIYSQLLLKHDLLFYLLRKKTIKKLYLFLDRDHLFIAILDQRIQMDQQNNKENIPPQQENNEDDRGKKAKAVLAERNNQEQVNIQIVQAANEEVNEQVDIDGKHVDDEVRIKF